MMMMMMIIIISIIYFFLFLFPGITVIPNIKNTINIYYYCNLLTYSLLLSIRNFFCNLTQHIFITHIFCLLKQLMMPSISVDLFTTFSLIAATGRLADFRK